MVEARTNKDGGRMLFRFSSYNNGVSSARAYNNDNTLASIAFSGAPIGSYSYSWDANKNKTAETITGVMSGYSFTTGTTGYDDEDRLTRFTRGTLSQSWNLTSVGDWASFTSSGVGFQPAIGPRTHGPTHELTSVGGSPVTHDTKGNITSKPSSLNPTDTSSLAWDFDNRLDAIDVDGDTNVDVTFEYDALGRRVRKNDIVYALSGQQVVAEYAAGTAAASPTEKYVYASYIDEPVLKDGTGGLQYYHRNQQYSVIALTGSTGTITERYAYDAYGKQAIIDATAFTIAASLVNNTYTYTGRRYETESGDFYYRARYYDAGLGRFLSRDPIGYTFDVSLYGGYFAMRGRVDPLGFSDLVPLVQDDTWHIDDPRTLFHSVVDGGCCKGSISAILGGGSYKLKKRYILGADGKPKLGADGKPKITTRRSSDLRGQFIMFGFDISPSSFGKYECHFQQYAKWQAYKGSTEVTGQSIDFNGVQHNVDEWTLDVPSGADSPYYDEESMSNITDSSIAILDRPLLLPNHVGSGVTKTIQSFETFLLCNGDVKFRMSWSKTCNGNTENSCVTSFDSGGAASGGIPHENDITGE